MRSKNTIYSMLDGWRLEKQTGLVAGLLAVILVFSGTYLSAQPVSGTKTIPGNYATITAAIADITSKGLGGATFLELQAGYTGAGESFPIVIGTITGASASNTLTIRPATGVTAKTITGSSTTAIFDLNGSRYTIIDGRPGGSGSSQELSIVNTNNNGPVVRLINDARNNTVEYCKVRSKNTSAANGVVFFSTTSGTTGNDNNTIANCDIDGTGTYYHAIYSAGTTTKENSSDTIRNNNIFNWDSTGVYITPTGNGDNWVISGNSFYNTGSPSSEQTAIRFSPGTASNGSLISGNFIGGQAPNCGGSAWSNTGLITFYGIFANVGSSVATVIQNNMVSNISLSGGSLQGIRDDSGLCQITGNTIGDPSVLDAITMGGSGTLYGLILSNVADSTSTLQGNIVANVTYTSASGGPVAFGALLFRGNALQNKIYKLGASSAGLGLVLRGMSINPNGPPSEISNNMISLDGGASTSAAIAGILLVSNSSSTVAVLDNSVYVGGSGNFSIAFERGGSVPVVLRNNIFFNARTGGFNLHHAIGSSSSTPGVGWTSMTSNYNMLVSSQDTTMGLWGSFASPGSNKTFSQWRSSSGGDNSSWSTTTATLSAANFFVDAANGDLRIKTANPEAWYANGKGLPLANISTDLFGNARSTSIATGATDIGAHEFTAGSTPIAATASGAPSPGATTTYTFAGRTVGSITWGLSGTLPSSTSFLYYSGTNPPGASAGLNANAYWDIIPTGGSGYQFDISLNYDPAILGAISAQSNTIIGKKDAGVWSPYVATTLDTTNKTVSLSSLTTFTNFTMTDKTNPLPVQLASFSAGARIGGTVLLEWSTISEVNNYGFYVQRCANNEQNFRELANSFVAGHGTTLQPQRYTYTDASVTSGSWSYRLKQIDLDGTVHYTDLVSIDILTDVKDASKPTTFALEQNYPNPFNPNSDIRYLISDIRNVRLAVYDLLGREVAVLVNERQVPGSYSVRFNANGLASGVYLYRLTAGTYTETKRLTLVK